MKKWLITLSLAALFFVQSFPANAEVMIAPTRVVMENGQRSAELIIVNKGNEKAAFRVSLENRRMRLDGSMDTVTNAQDGENFAMDHVRYSPRRVILEAGGKQTIRVSLKSTNLEPGEYRSHLRLMAAPTSAGRTLQSATGNKADSISIQLIAIRSLTIPVIARIGDLDTQITLDSAALKTVSHTEGDTIFEARLLRTGNKSTYGDVEIYVEGIDKPIYYARGIAVYTPNPERLVKLPIPNDVRDQLSGKSVRIVYKSSDPAKPEIFAELTTDIN